MNAIRTDPPVSTSWVCDVEGVYVHVPFCAADCAYCAFAREVPTSRGVVDDYLRALDRESRYWRVKLGARLSPRTLYVGGGTPTFLTPSEWDRLEESLSRLLDRSRLVEVTVEANPESTTREILARLTRFGTTRISIGAQAIASDTLRLLGRTHAWPAVERAVAFAREATLLVSVDLIYGVPGLSFATWQETLDEVLELGTDHLSAYCLSYEEGTSLSKRRAGGTLAAVSDETQRLAYEHLVGRAESAGLRRYEVSNFGTDAGRSRHNLGYWTGASYLGLGPSAHSHGRGARWRNHTHRERWQIALGEAAGPIASLERLGPEARAAETLMRLRVEDGVPLDLLPRPGGAFHARVAQLAGEGVVLVDANRLRLARDSFFISDGVVADLLAAWDEEDGGEDAA